MKPRLKNPRAVAAHALASVLGKGLSLDAALEQAYAMADEQIAEQRPLVQEISYGCMRWLTYLQAISDKLLKRKPKKKDLDVEMLVIIGLYQLLHLSIKEHAAVSETVAATADLGKPWAKGLINACLRNFQRQRDGLLQSLAAEDPDLPLSHPRWMLDELKRAWPAHWRQIAEANNQRPPMHLRANLERIERDESLARLRDAGIEAHSIDPVCGIALAHPQPVSQLPGFAEGELSVQDQSAQYAGLLLDPQPGERLLDACAAPGGKACHLLERVAGNARLTAIELDPLRAQRIRENLDRLQLEAEIIVADAMDTATWWDGQPFDRVLLDAPCSATGVIRRHPDIKHLRRPSDIDQLADIQAGLLDAMWPLLKQGGKLLYATCSIFERENELQIHAFLEKHGDATVLPIALEGDGDCSHGVQLFPGEGDGFYYCLLQKN